MSRYGQKGNIRVNKQLLIKALQNTELAVMGALESYEEEVQKWRETVVDQFSEFVRVFDPKTGQPHFQDYKFSPPRKVDMCHDWRITALNKHIARVSTMQGSAKTPDTLTIRNDDDIWTYVGIEACL